MSTFRFTAYPEDRYRPYKRKKRQKPEHWTAPEHGRFAKHMQRSYPVAHDGRRMVELGRELVLDLRPEILQPKRIPIFLGIDQ